MSVENKIILNIISDNLSKEHLKDENTIKQTKRTKRILCEPTFKSKESFPVSRLLALRDLLEDRLLLEKSSCKSRVKKRLNFVNGLIAVNKLETIELASDKFTRETSYGYLKPYKIGRVHSGDASVPYFPKDMRYLLLKDLYVDFDLVNCHPTILYEFSVNHTDLETPNLESLVVDRDKFKQDVLSELGPVRNLKVAILVSINFSKEGFTSKSHTLMALHEEIKALRVFIKEYFAKRYPDFSIEGMPLSTVQSHFCCSRESELVLALRDYLHLSINSIPEQLHFIPLYDGAYLHHEDYTVHYELGKYVSKFNKTQAYLKFEQKEIEANEDDVLLEHDLEKYLTIQKFLQFMDLRRFNSLLEVLDIPPFKIPEELLETILIELSDRSTLISGIKLKRKKLKLEMKKKSKKELPVEHLKQTLQDIEESLDSITPLGFLAENHSSSIRDLSMKFHSSVRNMLLIRTGCVEDRGKLLTKQDLDGLIDEPGLQQNAVIQPLF
jgi:hypothetical protein